ncbi:DUF4428 domain-containing protein [Oceanobacillus oncorhynchi]|uniref:DUF4428 domain-containing protein n=1 Tax=Oceanobacillus oncorhynchi TaxID=545501 RepID=UPI001869190C|nr:DUF4428 domain-containing protein [Oceanobacillus oncorhynchi]
MSDICAICGNETSFFQNRRKIANDEVICNACFLKAKTLSPKQMIFTKKVTADEIRESIKDSNKNGEKFLDFNSTREIGDIIKFDDDNKKILISEYLEYHVINYSDVISFELLEDGDVVKSSGLGRAVAGGLLFGGAGAVVGAVTGKGKEKNYCNSIKIRVNTKNLEQSSYYIIFLNKKVKVDSSEYTLAYLQANETLSILQTNCDVQEDDAESTTVSASDEILKYKNLLDAGAITEDEYNQKKKQLLGL